MTKMRSIQIRKITRILELAKNDKKNKLKPLISFNMKIRYVKIAKIYKNGVILYRFSSTYVIEFSCFIERLTEAEHY